MSIASRSGRNPLKGGRVRGGVGSSTHTLFSVYIHVQHLSITVARLTSARLTDMTPSALAQSH